MSGYSKLRESYGKQANEYYMAVAQPYSCGADEEGEQDDKWVKDIRLTNNIPRSIWPFDVFFRFN